MDTPTYWGTSGVLQVSEDADTADRVNLGIPQRLQNYLGVRQLDDWDRSIQEEKVFMEKGTKGISGSMALLALFVLVVSVLGCAEKRALVVVKGSPEERGGVQGQCRLGEYCGKITDALCSRDLKEIMDRAALDTFQKEELRTLICSGQSDTAAVEQYCSSLPDDTRMRLYGAFEQYGYHINGYG